MGTERRREFTSFAPRLWSHPSGVGVRGPKLCFGTSVPPPGSGPSPATLGSQLGEEGGQRKDKVSPRAYSAHSPVRLGRSALGSPGCLQSQPPVSLYSLFLPPWPCPGPVFKYPSSNCDGGGDSSWKPGLSPLPLWPAPGCPWAPKAESSVEPPPRPLPSRPLGAVAAQKHACARV